MIFPVMELIYFNMKQMERQVHACTCLCLWPIHRPAGTYRILLHVHTTCICLTSLQCWHADIAFDNVSSIHYREDPLTNTYELFDFESGKVLVR